MPAPVHSLTAYNTARESENKIHDDAVAKKFGFTGGFVPGTEVYGYMTHVPAARWGRDWLARGAMTARFNKPVYDEAPVEILATDEASGSVAVTVVSSGIECALGVAFEGHDRSPPEAAAYPRLPLPDLADRAKATPGTLAEGTALGTYELAVDAAALAAYLGDLRETLPLYADEGLIPSSIFLRMANWALSCTVRMGPWIHVSSAVHHCAPARVGEAMEARPIVKADYERRGHRFVELDVGVFGEGARPLAHVLHTAIYEPRQVRET